MIFKQGFFVFYALKKQLFILSLPLIFLTFISGFPHRLKFIPFPLAGRTNLNTLLYICFVFFIFILVVRLINMYIHRGSKKIRLINLKKKEIFSLFLRYCFVYVLALIPLFSIRLMRKLAVNIFGETSPLDILSFYGLGKEFWVHLSGIHNKAFLFFESLVILIASFYYFVCLAVFPLIFVAFILDKKPIKKTLFLSLQCFKMYFLSLVACFLFLLLLYFLTIFLQSLPLTAIISHIFNYDADNLYFMELAFIVDYIIGSLYIIFPALCYMEFRSHEPKKMQP